MRYHYMPTRMALSKELKYQKLERTRKNGSLHFSGGDVKQNKHFWKKFPFSSFIVDIHKLTMEPYWSTPPILLENCIREWKDMSHKDIYTEVYSSII